jgi:hypothetical protein
VRNDGRAPRSKKREDKHAAKFDLKEIAECILPNRDSILYRMANKPGHLEKPETVRDDNFTRKPCSSNGGKITTSPVAPEKYPAKLSK